LVCKRIDLDDCAMQIAQPLAEKELNGRGFNYVVKYKLLGSTGRPQTHTIADPRRSEIVIHDRETFRQYEISVQSANEMGLSTERVVSRIGYSGEGSKCGSLSKFISVCVYRSNCRLLFKLMIASMFIFYRF